MKLLISTFIVLSIVACTTSFSLSESSNVPKSNSSQLSTKETDNPLIQKRIHKKHRVFIPFARPLREEEPDNATCEDSSDEFPVFLNDYARNHGGVVLCFIIGIYCFTLLAVVCDKYFLPSVETICDVLHLTPDVAAATFMSVATSCPEMFTNIIGTFITESDIGIGTIVGSSLFNGLGVAAIGGLASITPLQLDWWPVTRDVCIYVMAVALLVVITWDGFVFWYEALILFIVYFAYFAIMFQNTRISRFVKSRLGKDRVEDLQTDEKPEARTSVISAYGTYLEEAHKPGYVKAHEKVIKELDEADKKEAEKSLFRIPEGSKLKKFIFFYTWPIQLILRFTIPNPKVHPKLFPISFLMCIVWIGTNSYMVSWMMSVIGSVFKIPDAVLGMTLLAAGGCLPESISMTIISRRGEGAFGVSNSLGANTMNILFSLGMPWFFKTITQGANSTSFIKIQSGSIEYTILALIGVSFCLFLTLFFNKFRLGKRAGSILITIYLIYVTLAILSELVFFDNDQSCDG
uniref:Sodium/potassium/calcium exchanger 5 n=1 Tax=Anoplophora glabripennis TaxID=217634 RepID=V5I898_ANOGL